MSDIHEIDLSISDHRPRVAAERRERMRQRLIESALLVFSEKGVESSMIHDVVLTANVSQGTFYNYFRSCDELLIATGEQLKNELLILIEQEVRTIADPAERLATGLRLFLHTTQAFPLLARFAHQTGLHIVGPNSLMFEFLPPHIEQGISMGRFAKIPVPAMLDLLSGTTLAAIFRIIATPDLPNYPEEIVSLILRGMGVTEEEAMRLVAQPLQPIQPPEDMLLIRSQTRWDSMEHTE